MPEEASLAFRMDCKLSTWMLLLLPAVDVAVAAAAAAVVLLEMNLMPPNVGGKKWYRAADTAGWMENRDNFTAAGSEELLTGPTYTLAGRSVLLLIEK